MEMVKGKRTTMYIDYNHLVNFEPFELCEIIGQEYYKYEAVLGKAVFNFLFSFNKDYARGKQFQVSFYNLHSIEDIRNLKTDRLGQLLSISGTLTKTSEVRPELYIGHFKCNNCGHDCGKKE